jgi:hypothetical protein
VALRGPRNQVDPKRPYAFHVEPERTPRGMVEDVATVFITNKECPFRCLMCDLWKNTTTTRVPDGSVAGQIEWALSQLPWAPHVKLYNSANFFDNQAIPRADRPQIARLLNDRTSVIVECHPKLVGPSCLDFGAALEPDLEVAMGLETIDPAVLPRLNKRMTLDDFEAATRLLTDHGIRVRAFILLRTPFQTEEEGIEWAIRSIDHAFSIGVECCSVVPTRAGNGAMERLAARGQFSPPSPASMEHVLAYGISLGRGRVFMDLWDAERFFDCPRCGPRRAERMRRMNLIQQSVEPVTCDCGANQ